MIPDWLDIAANPLPWSLTLLAFCLCGAVVLAWGVDRHRRARIHDERYEAIYRAWERSDVRWANALRDLVELCPTEDAETRSN